MKDICESDPSRTPRADARGLAVSLHRHQRPQAALDSGGEALAGPGRNSDATNLAQPGSQQYWAIFGWIA